MAGSYWVTGADGREYGPVSIEDMTRWIAEGRIVATSSVRTADSGWTEAGRMPEIAHLFAARQAPPSHPGPAAPAPGGTGAGGAGDFLVWSFIGQAWDLVKVHWLPLAAMLAG